MPNHLHALIDFSISEKNITTIVSNGKRLMPAWPVGLRDSEKIAGTK